MEIVEYKEKKQREMETILYDLIKNWEDEVVEFKEANNDYDKEKIGKYFSALSNEANLRAMQHGWLIFGVRNKNRAIIGTDYRNTEGLKTLKNEISQETSGAMGFIDIYEVYPVVDGEKKRVVMFQIPAAITAVPTAWKGQEYAREGELKRRSSQIPHVFLTADYTDLRNFYSIRMFKAWICFGFFLTKATLCIIFGNDLEDDSPMAPLEFLPPPPLPTLLTN